MHPEEDTKNKHTYHSQPDHTPEPGPENDPLSLYNLGLEDEAWRKIVKALAARGYPLKNEDLQGDRG
jgi:hypothetical protein